MGVTPGPVSVDPVTGRVYMLSTGGLLRLQPDGRSWKALSPFGASPLGLVGMSSSFGALAGTILLPSPLVRSTDGGASFEDAAVGELDASQLPANAVITPVGRSSFVAIGPYMNAVLMSPDLGASWLTQPGPAAEDDNFSNPILVAGGTPALLSAGSSGEIWRSGDLGMTWQPWQQVTPNLQVIAATPRAVYLLSTTTAIGQRLNVLEPGADHVSIVLPRLNVERVVLSSERPRLAVALGTARDRTEDLRAYVTRDAGATWTRLRLPAKAALCSDAGAALTPDGRLVVSLDGPRLYADLDPPSVCPIASVISTPLA